MKALPFVYICLLYNECRKSKYDLIKELYIKMKVQLLKPKTIVEYIRVPYIYSCGNVRITLDRAIRTIF